MGALALLASGKQIFCLVNKAGMVCQGKQPIPILSVWMWAELMGFQLGLQVLYRSCGVLVAMPWIAGSYQALVLQQFWRDRPFSNSLKCIYYIGGDT